MNTQKLRESFEAARAKEEEHELRQLANVLASIGLTFSDARRINPAGYERGLAGARERAAWNAAVQVLFVDSPEADDDQGHAKAAAFKAAIQEGFGPLDCVLAAMRRVQQ